MPWRAGGVAALRPDELRQGTARAGGPRVARRVADAVPGRAGRRHGMSRALDLAEQALRSAEGDEAEVLVHAERSGVARFAASEVHQPTLIDNAVVRVRVVRDGKIGWAATNRGRCRRPRRACASRRRGRGQRQAGPGLPRPCAAGRVPGRRRLRRGDRVARRRGPGATRRARRSRPRRDFGLYGYFTSGVTELAVASADRPQRGTRR